MWPVIPIYTTDSVPIDGSPPVTHAWPVWTVATDIGQGLESLAMSAASRGAHAVVGLRFATFSSHVMVDRYALMGTAVVLGGEPGPPPA